MIIESVKKNEKGMSLEGKNGKELKELRKKNCGFTRPHGKERSPGRKAVGNWRKSIRESERIAVMRRLEVKRKRSRRLIKFAEKNKFSMKKKGSGKEWKKRLKEPSVLVV
jgi:hypothetical protein